MPLKTPGNIYANLKETHNSMPPATNLDTGKLTFRQNAILLEILRVQLEILGELKRKPNGDDQ